jgi:hypothetical protein
MNDIPKVVLFLRRRVAAAFAALGALRGGDAQDAGQADAAPDGPRLILNVVGHSGEIGRLQGRPVYSEIVGTIQVDDAAPAPVRLRFDGAAQVPNVQKTVVLILSGQGDTKQEPGGCELTAIVRGARYVGILDLPQEECLAPSR